MKALVLETQQRIVRLQIRIGKAQDELIESQLRIISVASEVERNEEVGWVAVAA